MRRTALLAATVLLGACGAGPVVTHTGEFSSLAYGRSFDATGGLQSLEVVGAPPDGASPETIAARLRAPAFFQPTTYQAVPPGQGGLRTVLEFGAPYSGDTSCRSPRGNATSGGLLVSATICSGAYSYATATVRDPDVQGPSSPGYDQAMNQLMLGLTARDRRRTFDIRED